ncbi:MAG: hypothetical protein JO257_36045 [Deltaproteobacteria bacterium]|nr:hypothetical protein [Deltaproteobacteria bacterium]
MRRPALLALLLAGCATRTHAYRFASPMLGAADVPPPPLAAPLAAPRPPEPARLAHHAAPLHTTTARGVPGIEAAPPPIASAAAADAVAAQATATGVVEPAASGVVISRLPAPHRLPSDAPLLAPHTPADLRALVGRRTKANAFDLAIAWADALGADAPAVREGEPLLSWARETSRLRELDEAPQPGDLLVFDQIESDADADLIAVVVARDDRAVTEFVYASGGVIRRGFLDANRPSLRRDHEGRGVNTFMRSGKRWPPKGTHYLAGELLSHVIHTH